MSLLFSSGELAEMRGAQEAHMMDEVVRMVWSSTKDALNADVSKWTDGKIIACGIDMTGGSEQRDSGKFMVTWDVRLRMPLGTAFDLRDRFRISSRFGQPTNTNIVYEIVSPAEEGPSGIVISLRKVEPSE
jgi:head-tail adaptor